MAIDHGAIRKLWHSNEPLTIEDVRMSVNRNHTALPRTPKSFEIRTLELLERMDLMYLSARMAMAESVLFEEHGKGWYLGDATDAEWIHAYEVVDEKLDQRG